MNNGSTPNHGYVERGWTKKERQVRSLFIAACRALTPASLSPEITVLFDQEFSNGKGKAIYIQA
jgi:hypothetical protein